MAQIKFSVSQNKTQRCENYKETLETKAGLIEVRGKRERVGVTNNEILYVCARNYKGSNLIIKTLL